MKKRGKGTLRPGNQKVACAVCGEIHWPNHLRESSFGLTCEGCWGSVLLSNPTESVREARGLTPTVPIAPRAGVHIRPGRVP